MCHVLPRHVTHHFRSTDAIAYVYRNADTHVINPQRIPNANRYPCTASNVFRTPRNNISTKDNTHMKPNERDSGTKTEAIIRGRKEV
jgi:hypothetical protein